MFGGTASLPAPLFGRAVIVDAANMSLVVLPTAAGQAAAHIPVHTSARDPGNRVRVAPRPNTATGLARMRVMPAAHRGGAANNGQSQQGLFVRAPRGLAPRAPGGLAPQRLTIPTLRRRLYGGGTNAPERWRHQFAQQRRPLGHDGQRSGGGRPTTAGGNNPTISRLAAAIPARAAESDLPDMDSTLPEIMEDSRKRSVPVTTTPLPPADGSRRPGHHRAAAGNHDAYDDDDDGAYDEDEYDDDDDDDDDYDDDEVDEDDDDNDEDDEDDDSEDAAEFEPSESLLQALEASLEEMGFPDSAAEYVASAVTRLAASGVAGPIGVCELCGKVGLGLHYAQMGVAVLPTSEEETAAAAVAAEAGQGVASGDDDEQPQLQAAAETDEGSGGDDEAGGGDADEDGDADDDTYQIVDAVVCLDCRYFCVHCHCAAAGMDNGLCFACTMCASDPAAFEERACAADSGGGSECPVHLGEYEAGVVLSEQLYLTADDGASDDDDDDDDDDDPEAEDEDEDEDADPDETGQSSSSSGDDDDDDDEADDAGPFCQDCTEDDEVCRRRCR